MTKGRDSNSQPIAMNAMKTAIDTPRPRPLSSAYESRSVALVQELREHINAARTASP